MSKSNISLVYRSASCKIYLTAELWFFQMQILYDIVVAGTHLSLSSAIENNKRDRKFKAQDICRPQNFSNIQFYLYS